MAEDFIGWSALVFTLCIVTLLAWTRVQIAWILLVGGWLRAAAAVFHYYIMPLPDGSADAVFFEYRAWLLASSPGTIIENFSYTISFAYSAALALFYELVQMRSPLMLQALSVLAGSVCVVLVYEFTLLLWRDQAAAKTATLLATFCPTAVLYSALTMREMFFCLTLLLGLFYVVKWVRDKSAVNMFISLMSLSSGVLIHTGMLSVIFVVLAYATLHVLKDFMRNLEIRKISLWHALIIVGIVTLIFLVLAIDPTVQKFGPVTELLNPDRYINPLSNRVRGTAAYPSWTIPVSSFDLLWVIPLRSAYLLWSPFPWDVTSVSHLFGTLDACLYLMLVPLAALTAISKYKSKSVILLAMVLIVLIMVFGIGTGNFGTALRHRTKFLFLLIVFAAPALVHLGRAAKASLSKASSPANTDSSEAGEI